MYENKVVSQNIAPFLETIDLTIMLSWISSSAWYFPKLNSEIESILNPPKLMGIDDNQVGSNKEICFKTCIEIGHEWIHWFLKFFDIFEYPLGWFKHHQINIALDLFLELTAGKKDPVVTLLEMKTTVEKIIKFLDPLEKLQRLCHLFNCLVSLKFIEKGTINNGENRAEFIENLQTSYRKNQFQLDSKSVIEYPVKVNNRQHIHWSLTSEQFECSVKVEYTTVDNDSHVLFDQNAVPLNQKILNGKFETQKAGSLLFTIGNHIGNTTERIWFRIKSTDLSKCYLFNGIFDLFYQQYRQQLSGVINQDQLNNLLNDTFLFIDKLLEGTISLKDMNKLKTTFYKKNILVQDEVRSLCINRSDANQFKQERNVKYPTDEEIEEVCERIQIYQYYSHINNIIECIKKFDILPESDTKLIENFENLSNDEKSNLSQISNVYKILKEQLTCLSSSHLLLIKTVHKCAAVIELMKSTDLYSINGRHRFQELQDNLTVQFQLQERNNTILHALIIIYKLCEPFVIKANSFTEFTNRISQLQNIDDSSLKHIDGT